MTTLAFTEPGAGAEDGAAMVHATAVAVGGAGVLLRGPSGSGKSDLALRLIDDGARLVTDDQAVLERHGTHLVVSAPGAIAGKLEVRGVGIATLRPAGPTRVRLVVDLVSADQVDRLPRNRRVELLGAEIVGVQIVACEPSAAAKVRVALSQLDIN